MELITKYQAQGTIKLYASQPHSTYTQSRYYSIPHRIHQSITTSRTHFAMFHELRLDSWLTTSVQPS